MKKILLSVSAFIVSAGLGFAQTTQTADLGSIIGINATSTETTGFSIFFADATATGGGWLDKNTLGASYDEQDECIIINLPDDPSGTMDWWDRGDFQFCQDVTGGSGKIPFMLSGNTKARIVVKTPDTLYYWIKIDKTPRSSTFKALEIGDTIKTLNQKITIDINLPVPVGADLNTTDYNTLYLFLSTTNRKLSSVRLYEISIGDMVTTFAPINDEIPFGKLLYNSNIVKAESYSVVGQLLGTAESVSGLSLPKGISIIKATLKDGSSLLAKVVK